MSQKKKLQKRFLVLVTMMIVSVASQAYDAYIDGIYYNLNKKAKTAEVTMSGINYGSVTIPPHITYKGVNYNVKIIGSSAFCYCSSLREVHSLNQLPPACVSSTFKGVNMKQVKVYVPVSSKKNYSKRGPSDRNLNYLSVM